MIQAQLLWKRLVLTNASFKKVLPKIINQIKCLVTALKRDVISSTAVMFEAFHLQESGFRQH